MAPRTARHRLPWKLIIGAVGIKPVSHAIALALVGVVAGLLLVGVVSHTLLRHAPGRAGLDCAFSRRTAIAAGALRQPTHFLVLVFIMGLIWLYLLGVARIITGNFSPAKIACTILIGVSCVLGLVASYRSRASAVNLVGGFVVFAGFAALQVLFLWLSLRPGIAGV